MRFSTVGEFVQQRPYAEGSILQQLVLPQFNDSGTHFDVDSTYILREMFSTGPPMELLYPLLVEFTMQFKYPKMVDRADIERKPCKLGMTANGLDRLNAMLRKHYYIYKEF